jgi:glycosyltransferase involved in cell wall biosynthesis
MAGPVDSRWSGRPGSPLVRVRVLLLARTASALPPQPPWDPRSRRWPWAAACGEPADPGYEVTPVTGAPGARAPVGPRAVLGRLRRTLRAGAGGAPTAWAQALSTDTDLRRAVRRADVVWSLDRDTDAALAALPRLTEGRTVLPSDRSASLFPALASLDALLAEVAAPPGGRGRRSARAAGRDVERWARLAAALPVAELPEGLRPLDAVTEALRTRRHHHRLLSAERAVVALDAAPWPEEARSRSGLAAQRAAADLYLGFVTWDAVDEDLLGKVAAAAVRGADDVLDDDPALALARLGDAMALLFHRARHAEVPRSALVEDPTAYLAALRGSRTYRTLLLAQDGSGAQDLPRPAMDDSSGASRVVRPDAQDVSRRVLVVTGAYGQFHQSVAEALGDDAEVRTVDLAEEHPVLARKVLTPSSLPALAAVLAEQREGELPGWADSRLRTQVQRISASLRETLTWPDVIFADWADPATAWVSHLCPPGVRLVVRIHALDGLDPWLHLVRWERVERVLVISEPMRSLVVDLLDRLPGPTPPVTPMEVITGLREMDLPKSATARTTLGMIGWGRRVKDVLWALDLLERDPSWRLVLIGPGFPDRNGPVVAPYVEEVLDRLGSPALRDRVDLVGPVTDVAAPMREVGVVLSTSLREGWHLGLVEGAASGAVPVVRDWPFFASRGGPRTLYPPEWVVDDLDAAEARVRRVTDPRAWEEESVRARAQALALFDPEQVAEDYRRVVLDGHVPSGV